VWPWFDGGSTTCNALWVSPDILTVSKVNDGLAGTSPSIAVTGTTYHVAFVEAKKVRVRTVTPGAKSSTGPIQQLSKSALEAVNPWLISRSGTMLAAVWSEKNPGTTTSCASFLMFSEFAAGNAVNAKLVNLSAAYPTMGYEWPTMVFHGGSYSLWAAVQYQGMACNTHLKGSYHSAASPTGLSSAYSWGAGMWYPTIALTGGSTTPYAMLRFSGPDGTPNPASVTPQLYATATPASWETAPVYTGPTNALPLRPAVLGDGTATWMAWTSSARTGPTVRVVRRDTTGAVSTRDVSQLSRNPFFARRADAQVLVYSRVDANGTPASIEIAKVGFDAATGVQIGSGLALSSTGQPDTPVVAAGKSGFGVAWVEKVGSITEVRFRWVGCL
jgi:hypothetical protein